MIDTLIEASVRHRVAVVVVAAATGLIGWQAATRLPLDALPDIGDREVIVRSEWERSPEVMDAQVTQPIVSALSGMPGVTSVRGISDFGSSIVHVILEDDADIFRARSRTLEALSGVSRRLPEGVKTELGADATSLGWIFQYVVSDRSGTHTLQELRALQDWYVAPLLKTAAGVAEVATVGGLVRQYQVNVDPRRLRTYGLAIQQVAESLKHGNRDVGGLVVESAGAEFVVRGVASARSIADLEQTLVATSDDGTPIRVKDVAVVTIGSDFRRGVADLDGSGEVVSGIVVMRQGANALAVIDRVKDRIRQLASSLPAGVEIVPVYDRSGLIRRSIATLKWTIAEEMITVAIVILVFLWHLPSAAVPLATLPLAVLISFIPLQWLGAGINVMSLGGIAMAVGVMMDASIVIGDQTHKRLEEWTAGRVAGNLRVLIVRAIQEAARPGFFALLVIAVSFLPVLTLQGEAGRLFKPLAYAKSAAVIVAALLAVTLDPALRLLIIRGSGFNFRPLWLRRVADAALVGTVRTEQQHFLNRWIIRVYEPIVQWSLRHRLIVLGSPLVLIAATIPVWQRLGSEFMPPLDEGALLYMPSTMPGMSIAEAQRLLQTTDRILKDFPEVEQVLGKAGRADTATDPAPLSMLETIVILRPSSSWRRVATWYSGWAPDWLRPLLRRVTPDHVSSEELVSEMDRALTIPGVANAWSMPMRGRVDMLTTGLRTGIGLKIAGRDLREIERIGSQIESLLPAVEGTRGAFAERVGDGYFLDVQWNRAALARAGIAVDQAQAAIEYGIGGVNVTAMIEGRERFPVNVRYARDFRADSQAMSRVLVPAAGGRQIPIAELADIRTASAPVMLRNDDGLLTGYVYVDVAGRDSGSYVADADRTIRRHVALPPGYSLSWSGDSETMAATRRQLAQIVPLTLLLIFVLLYVSTRSLPATLIVLSAVPFSVVGAAGLLYALGYHMSAAVWVGLIALLGVDAETGVFMLLYLDAACERAKQTDRFNSLVDLEEAILDGAARRVRPKFMTVTAILAGLLPIMWSTGAGSDVMKRIAAPMIGGICTSFVLELIVYPTLYYAWKSRFWRCRLTASTG